MKLHHVQISMPRGEEDDARRFYGEALGLHEVQKPPSLVGRGGCWFRAFDGDVIAAEIHLGVDDPFSPARHLEVKESAAHGIRIGWTEAA